MAETLTTPVLDGSALDARTVQLTGLTDDNAVSYDLRYGTSSNLSSTTASTISPNANGVYEVESLNAATTYYFQVRAVGDGTNYLTSEWSNTKAIKTGNLWPEIVVQNLNDSGAGSLRQALNDIAANGTITFDDSLSGGTIYLQSALTADRACTIDGSELEEKITLDGGGDLSTNTFNSVVVSASSAAFKSIKFSNFASNTVTSPVSAYYSFDCVFDNIGTTITGATTTVISFGTCVRCVFRDIHRHIGYGGTFSNCLFLMLDNEGSIISRSVTYKNCTFTGALNPYQAVQAIQNCLLKSGYTANNCVAFGENAADYFVDPENGDYHLKAGSPAIGAGSNSYVEQPASATDLDGNARIQGTNVDVGCYEYTPVTLTAPTITFTSPTENSVQINLPAAQSYETKKVLQYSTNADFTNATETNVTGVSFLASTLSGTVYFRAKCIGDNEHSYDSTWGATASRYFGTSAPEIIGVDTESALEIVVGTSTNLKSGITVEDDIDDDLIVNYYILDAEGNYVYQGTNYQDIDADSLVVGEYTIQYFATDSSGNESDFVERDLVVLAVQLTTPAISAIALDSARIAISGLSATEATSYAIRYATTLSGLSSASPAAITPTSGTGIITGLTGGQTYYVQAQFVGNDTDYRSSAWSNTATATTFALGSAEITAATSAADSIDFTISTASGLLAVALRFARSAGNLATADPIFYSIPSDNVITLTDLQPQVGYFVQLAAVDTSGNIGTYSTIKFYQTTAETGTSDEIKLKSIQRRISNIRKLLEGDEINKNVSVDGISETWIISREKLNEELLALERQEGLLTGDNPRLLQIDLTRQF